MEITASKKKTFLRQKPLLYNERSTSESYLKIQLYVKCSLNNMDRYAVMSRYKRRYRLIIHLSFFTDCTRT